MSTKYDAKNMNLENVQHKSVPSSLRTVEGHSSLGLYRVVSRTYFK